MSVFIRIKQSGKNSLVAILLSLMAVGLQGCATTSASSTQSAKSADADDWDEDPGRFEWEFTVSPDSEAEADKVADQDASSDTTANPKPGKTATKKPTRVYYSAEDDEDGDRGFVLHRSNEEDDFDD